MGIRSVLEDLVFLQLHLYVWILCYFILELPKFCIKSYILFKLASPSSALVAAVYVNPFMLQQRFITGISLASCYVVTESWLNDRATNKNRGQLLSAQMVIYFG